MTYPYEPMDAPALTSPDDSGWQQRLRVALQHSLGLTDDNTLLVVWDGRSPRGLVDDLLSVGSTVARTASLVHYVPTSRLPQSRLCYFAQAALGETRQLPEPVAAAMAGADRIVLVLSDLEVLFSARVGAIADSDRRLIMFPYSDIPGIRRLLPASADEADALAEFTTAIGGLVAEAHTARVTSPAGTDLTWAFGPDFTCIYGGRASRGEIQILPGGQVSRMPREGTANGTVVIDRTIAHGDYKALTEAITLTVREGYVVDIQGGEDASYLASFLAGLDDPAAYHLTELGVGLNPRCHHTGTNAPAEDTHALGTCSFALGCDSHLGGVVGARVHIDMTMHQPTVEIDGRTLIGGGRFADIPEEAQRHLSRLEQSFAAEPS